MAALLEGSLPPFHPSTLTPRLIVSPPFLPFPPTRGLFGKTSPLTVPPFFSRPFYVSALIGHSFRECHLFKSSFPLAYRKVDKFILSLPAFPFFCPVPHSSFCPQSPLGDLGRSSLSVALFYLRILSPFFSLQQHPPACWPSPP